MTEKNINSGTDRIASVIGKLPKTPDLIVNIQADEPSIDSNSIDELIIETFKSDCDVGTLISPIKIFDELMNPSVVKVIINDNAQAIYFSRSPIPYLRDIPDEKWLSHHTFYKHIGVYAYKLDVLKKFTILPTSKLELAEKLEQLRLLESGYQFLCVTTNKNMIGIDTPEDLELAKKLMNSN